MSLKKHLELRAEETREMTVGQAEQPASEDPSGSLQWERTGNVLEKSNRQGRSLGPRCRAAAHQGWFILRTTEAIKGSECGGGRSSRRDSGIPETNYYEWKDPESPSLFQNLSKIWVWGDFLKISIYLILTRGYVYWFEREREREKHWCEREILIGRLLYVPRQGSNPQRKLCPDREWNLQPFGV